MRSAVAFIISAIAAFAAYKTVVPACSCNAEMLRDRVRIERLFSDPARSPALARDILQRMDHCIVTRPDLVQPYMIAAAAARITGQNGRAEELYESALRYDIRPEILFNLAVVQIEMGKRDEALRNFERAATFNSDYVESIPDGEAHDAVAARVYAREMRLRDRTP